MYAADYLALVLLVLARVRVSPQETVRLVVTAAVEMILDPQAAR